MGQGHFSHLGRVGGALGCPVGKRRAEPVRNRRQLHPAHDQRQAHVAELLVASSARKDQVGAFELGQPGQQLDDRRGQGDAMRPARLHVVSRNAPGACCQIHLGPCSATGLAGTAGVRDGELQAAGAHALDAAQALHEGVHGVNRHGFKGLALVDL